VQEKITLADYEELIIIRQYNSDKDLPFLYSRFNKVFRQIGHYQLTRSNTYFKNQTNKLNEILKTAQCYILTHKQDVNNIIGFVLAEEHMGLTIIHMAYLKEPYQNMGIMSYTLKLLIPDFTKKEIAITETTPKVKMKCDKYKLIFNPQIKDELKGLI